MSENLQLWLLNVITHPHFLKLPTAILRIGNGRYTSRCSLEKKENRKCSLDDVASKIMRKPADIMPH